MFLRRSYLCVAITVPHHVTNVKGSQQRENAGGEEMKPMTRRERRAERQRQHLMNRATRQASPDYQTSGERGAPGEVNCEGPLPGWLRPLDYKVSSESGALRVRSKVRTWHLGGRANGHAPPPGRGWDKSGPTYLVEIGGTRLGKPINHHRRRRLAAEQTAGSVGA